MRLRTFVSGRGRRRAQLRTSGAAVSQYNSEFFTSRQRSARAAAGEVVPLVLDLVRPRSVIDVGCAMGEWLSVFREHGVEDFHGVDGDYIQRDALLIPQDRFSSCDLTKAIDVQRRFDLAVSLEVAEHLPESSAAEFIHSLVRLAPLVLFSAAIPFQGGTGHLNEQWQDYWAAHFESHGYVMIDALRTRVWYNTKVPRWYKQNMLLYAHSEVLEERDDLRRERDLTVGNPVNLVHPDSYLKKARPSLKRLRRMIKAHFAERLRSRWCRLWRGGRVSAKPIDGRAQRGLSS